MASRSGLRAALAAVVWVRFVFLGCPSGDHCDNGHLSGPLLATLLLGYLAWRRLG